MSKLQCPTCFHYFDPQVHTDSVAEFCSDRCASVAQTYLEAGTMRVCFRCRAEFPALEPDWRLCGNCARNRARNSRDIRNLCSRDIDGRLVRNE